MEQNGQAESSVCLLVTSRRFKLVEGRFRLDVREKFFTERGEVLGQAGQRGCGCPIPGSVQDQVGCGPGQRALVPDLEVDGPASDRVVGT